MSKGVVIESKSCYDTSLTEKLRAEVLSLVLISCCSFRIFIILFYRGNTRIAAKRDLVKPQIPYR